METDDKNNSLKPIIRTPRCQINEIRITVKEIILKQERRLPKKQITNLLHSFLEVEVQIILTHLTESKGIHLPAYNRMVIFTFTPTLAANEATGIDCLLYVSCRSCIGAAFFYQRIC